MLLLSSIHPFQTHWNVQGETGSSIAPIISEYSLSGENANDFLIISEFRSIVDSQATLHYKLIQNLQQLLTHEIP